MPDGLRIAVAGKGGAGKSVIAGTLARLAAREGRSVLALDSDPMPGLAFSLGVDEPAEPPLNAAAERDERGRWRLRRGIGPVRAVSRYSTPAPDGIRLLQLGKAGPAGLADVMPAVQAFYRVVHRLHEADSFRDWSVVGDLSAGGRQVAARFAPYARTFVVVAEPSSQSALTARRIARIVRSEPGAEVRFVANKVRGEEDRALVERLIGERVACAVPADQSIAAAERDGRAPIDADPGSPAIVAIAALARSLQARTLRRRVERR